MFLIIISIVLLIFIVWFALATRGKGSAKDAKILDAFLKKAGPKV